MYCLYVCACTALGSYKRLSQPPHPLQLELQTTVRNQTLATSTAPFLIIVFWIALIGKQIMLNSKSWSRVCSVINVLSNSILPPYFLTTALHLRLHTAPGMAPPGCGLC